MIVTRHVVFWIVLAMIAAAAPVTATNLFTNPGFESGSSGWTASDWLFGNTGLNHTGLGSAETGCVGSQCITTPTAFFFQDLTTVIGQTYAFTFWYTNNGGAPNELQALAGGVVVSDSIDQPGDSVYRQVLTTFTASAVTTRIQFNGRNDPAELIVDDVCADLNSGAGACGVVEAAVPEPSTWLLTGAGALALLMTRRLRFVKPS